MVPARCGWLHLHVWGDQVGVSTIHSKSGLHRGQGTVEHSEKNEICREEGMGCCWSNYPGWGQHVQCSAVHILLNCHNGWMEWRRRWRAILDLLEGSKWFFVEDFGQLAPVPPIERIADVDGKAVFRNKPVSYAFSSVAWAQANKRLYHLTHSHRYKAGGERA